MNSSLHLKSQLDYPRSFESLGDFRESVMDAIARNDQALFDYLSENFAVGDNGVTFIGLGHGGECNQHWAQKHSSKKETEGKF